MTRHGAVVGLAVAALLTGCASGFGGFGAAPDSSGSRGVARIAPGVQSVMQQDVLARMRSARYVLLGEVHDNAEQHRLRASWLRELLSDGRPTWVVFEQIDRQHNAAVAAAPRDVDAIVKAGQLNQKGWAWPLHRPLFEVAVAAGATVVAGNLSRAELSPVVRQGEAGMPAELRRWFDGSMRTAEWGPAQTEVMLRLVDEGHCKALPGAMMAPMALAQRARDAALAQAMLQAPPGVRVVLIAGNGHVRQDVGVPRYLAAAGVAAAEVLSLGFEESETSVPASAAGPSATDPRYDLVWHTAAAARTDPCESFRVPAKPGPA